MRCTTTAVVAALGVLASCLLVAASADAHGGDPNYRSDINTISPDTPGLSAEIQDFDADLKFTNDSDSTVIVMGYNDEPYLRFDPDGNVYANQNSPATYLNTDRYGRTDVPDDVNPKDPPDWEQVADVGEYTWHDHRSHYMSTGTPAIVKDKDVKTKVFDYSIPIEVDGKKGAIDGTLFWVGQHQDTPVLPFVILGIITLGLIALVIVVRRRRRDSDDGEGGSGSGPDATPQAKEAW